MNENSVMTHFVKNFMGPGEKDRLTVALEALKNNDIGDLRDYCTKFSDLAQRAGYKDNERASIALFERHLCKEAMDRLQQAKDKRDEEGNGEFNSLKLEIEVVLRLIKFAPATYMEKLRAEMNNEKPDKTKDKKINKKSDDDSDTIKDTKRDKTGKSEVNSKKPVDNEMSKRRFPPRYGRNDPYIKFTPDQRYDHWKKVEAEKQKQLDAHVTTLVSEQMKSLNIEKNLATNVNVATSTNNLNNSTNNINSNMNSNQITNNNNNNNSSSNVNTTTTRSTSPRPILKKVKFRKDQEDLDDDDSSDDDRTLYQYVVKKKNKSKFRNLHEMEDDYDINAVNATDFDRTRPQALAQAGQGGGRGAYNNRIKTYANNQQQRPAVDPNININTPNAPNQALIQNNNNGLTNNAFGGRNNTPCTFCGVPGHSLNACFKKRQSEFETENKKLQTQIETLQKVVQDQNQIKNIRIVRSTNLDAEDNSPTHVNSLMNRRLTSDQRKVIDYSHLLPNNVNVIQTYNVATAGKNKSHSIEKIMLCQIEGLETLLSPLNDTGADISIISLDVANKYKLTIHLPDDENMGIRVADRRILMRIGYVTIKIHILFPCDEHRQTIEAIKKFEVMETAIPFIFGTDLLPTIFPRDEILKYVPKARSISLVPFDIKYVNAKPFNHNSTVWLDKNQEIKFHELSTQDKCMMSMNMINDLKITYVNMLSVTKIFNDEPECDSIDDVSIQSNKYLKTEKLNKINTDTDIDRTVIDNSNQDNSIDMNSKIPTAETVIRCSLCPLRTFASEFDFEAHKKAVHVPGKIKCYNCNYWFDDKTALDNHKIKDNCNKEQKQKKKQLETLPTESSLSSYSSTSSSTPPINKNIILSKHHEQSQVRYCNHCHSSHSVDYHCDESVEATRRNYENILAEKQRQEQNKHHQLNMNVPILAPWEEYRSTRENEMTRGNVSSTPSTSFTPITIATSPTSLRSSPSISTISQQPTPIMPSPLPTLFTPHIIPTTSTSHFIPLPPQLQSQRPEITMEDVFDLEEWFREKGISVLITRQNYEEMREQRRNLVGNVRPTPTEHLSPQRHGSRRYQDRIGNTNVNINTTTTDTSLIPRQRSRETSDYDSSTMPQRMCRFKFNCTHTDCRFKHPEGWNPIEAQRQRAERSRSPPITNTNTTITTFTSTSQSTSTSRSN